MKYLSIVLAFLTLPMITVPASAAQYCVQMPTSGNSVWSRRDNDVKMRFAVTYWLHKEEMLPDNWLSNRVGQVSKAKTTRVYGYKVENKDASYRSHRYKSDTVCIDMARLKGVVAAYEAFRPNLLTDPNGKQYYGKAPTISKVQVRADVRWGKDCPKVFLDSKTDQTFKVYRRKHNHVDPWGCRK